MIRGPARGPAHSTVRTTHRQISRTAGAGAGAGARLAYESSAAHAPTLDRPGPSTSRPDRLTFHEAPRPLYPLDRVG